MEERELKVGDVVLLNYKMYKEERGNFFWNNAMCEAAKGKTPLTIVRFENDGDGKSFFRVKPELMSCILHKDWVTLVAKEKQDKAEEWEPEVGDVVRLDDEKKEKIQGFIWDEPMIAAARRGTRLTVSEYWSTIGDGKTFFKVTGDVTLENHKIHKSWVTLLKKKLDKKESFDVKYANQFYSQAVAMGLKHSDDSINIPALREARILFEKAQKIYQNCGRLNDSAITLIIIAELQYELSSLCADKKGKRAYLKEAMSNILLSWSHLDAAQAPQEWNSRREKIQNSVATALASLPAQVKPATTTEVVASEPKGEPVEKKNITQNLTSVKDQIVASGKTGLKIGGSKKAVKTIVTQVKKLLGDKYPTFFSTPVGKKVEPYLVSVIVLTACELFSDRLPTLSPVKEAANLAISGFVAQDAEELLDMVEPFLVTLAEQVTK